jgi:hypothetical protein
VASTRGSIVDEVQQTRTYTVEEANRELARVRPIVAQIAELSALRPDLEEQLRMAEYAAKRPGANGADHERELQARDAVRGAEEQLLKAVLSLNALGIHIKGWIDFRSYRDGELVELCWKLGEDRVEHWHRIGEGFAGRKRL